MATSQRLLQLSTNDLVMIEDLSFNANIGPDCWNRPRPQPLLLSVAIEANLEGAGYDDDVNQSVNYGTLSKELLALAGNQTFPDMQTLVEEAAKLSLSKLPPGEKGSVKVTLKAPKLLLQDAMLSLEISRIAGESLEWGKRWNWMLHDWRVPVLIGLNPPEREAKQILVLDVALHMNRSIEQEVCSVPELVSHLIKWIDTTSYLTLEKFAAEFCNKAMSQHPQTVSIVLKVSKPSAVLNARAACIQIHRTRK
ncbi:trifunctional dihydropteroate synthetase [Serendipita sp. 411]|nr:trifunctional dihydropteroate synthetase [Serendipita sp. 411]